MGPVHRDGVADRVILEFSPTDEQTADALRAGSYRRYLKRTRKGPLHIDDEWREFVSCGCGSTRDVVLRVADFSGGIRLTEATDIVFKPTPT